MDLGTLMVQSTDRTEQAASVAAWIALILTRAGSQTNFAKLSDTPSELTSTPAQIWPSA